MEAVPHVPPPPGPDASALRPAWLWAGTTGSGSVTLGRKIVQVNLGAFGILLTVGLYFGVYQWLGNEALLRAGWAQLPFAALSPLVWHLNRRGRTQAARWLVFFTAMGGTLAAIVAGLGTVAGAHVYFLLFAVLTLSFFPLQDWRLALLLAVVNGAVYLALEHIGWDPHPALHALPTSTLEVLSRSFVAGCLLVAIVLTAVSEWAADHNEQRLAQLAETDVLTGLPNRRALYRVLDTELARSARGSGSLALAVLDLDHFKRINDEAGHEGGDRVLSAVAEALRQGQRRGDVAARVGGEEFVVLMPATDLVQGVAGLERLAARLAGLSLSHRGWTGQLTVSAGVATWRPGMDADGLMRAADAALYRAKREGRNRVVAAD